MCFFCPGKFSGISVVDLPRAFMTSYFPSKTGFISITVQNFQRESLTLRVVLEPFQVCCSVHRLVSPGGSKETKSPNRTMFHEEVQINGSLSHSNGNIFLTFDDFTLKVQKQELINSVPACFAGRDNAEVQNPCTGTPQRRAVV